MQRLWQKRQEIPAWQEYNKFFGGFKMDNKAFVKELVDKARVAQLEFEKFNQEQVDKIVKAIAKVVYDNAEPLAKMAVEETRMGVYEHKIKKNQGKAKIIWNNLKTKKSVGVIKRDMATGITEVARPVGVVGAVTPCTNPIVTPMCNAMFALKGRNAIIIAPHPRAKKCAKTVVAMFSAEIEKLGAPKNLIQVIEEPSVELSNELMSAVDIIVATGGMPMVKAAYSSGKPAYGVGVGNVQCIIDRGVDFKEAVPKIIDGREFDNGIICSGEQTIILPEELYDDIIKEFQKNNCFYVEDKTTKDKISAVLFPDGIMNKDLVGMPATKVAELAGISVPQNTRVILLKADGYGDKDILSKEKMCPVISTYKYKKFDEAITIAQSNLDIDGRGHSVSIHSANVENIEKAANILTVSRVLINQICSTMNGGSFFNSLAPTTTLGCASWGGNSISENFDYKHLLNITRIAYFLKDNKMPTDEEIWGE